MKVLLVEDHAPSREQLTDALLSRGCEVAAAADGSEGLEKFKESPADIILTDIQMPRMDGLELLGALREEAPDSIVILMTGYGSEEYAIEALRRGANNYLQKPIRHKDLFRLLWKYSSLLEARSVQQAIVGLIAHRSLTMFLENDLALVPKVVDRLMLETGDAIPARDRLGVHLALAELLINSIEHGNLGITYEEKSAALGDRPERLLELYGERLARPELSGRRVRVDFSMNHGAECEWVIADEGAGFDWEKVPDPTDPANRDALHGRGILISRSQFDELEFLGAGNQVRVRKTAAR